MQYSHEVFDDIAADGKNNALLIIENERVVYASPAFLEMMGYKEGELPGFSGNDIRAKIHPDDKEKLDATISETLTNKRAVAHYTFREMTRYGHYILREDYARFHYDKDGKHVRTYVICRDITDMPERKVYVELLHRAVRVLIAEDNRMNMLLTSELISQVFPNCVITEAWDGQHAVDAFRQTMPDLVLMDINMPVKDGYQATREIRNHEDAYLVRMPVIAITARLQPGEKERCLEAGLNDYIPKPVDEKEFKNIVLQHAMPYLFERYHKEKTGSE